MWRGISRDMYSLMRHVVGATTTVTWLRRIVAHYRHGRDAGRDRHSASSNSSSHDRSPCIALDEKPPLGSSSSHHGDEVGPLATSSQHLEASISTHDHEQAGPSIIEAAPLTEQASTTTDIDVVVPPADPWYLYYSCIFFTLYIYIYIYIYGPCILCSCCSCT